MNIHNATVYTGRNGSRNGSDGAGNGGNGNGHSPLLVKGRDVIARTNHDAGERAGLAAQLVADEVRLIKPTVAQAAAVTHATIHSTYAALHFSPGIRAHVAAGELSLADAARGYGLISAWLAASPAEKAGLGVAVGVDEVWDAVISPSI